MTKWQFAAVFMILLCIDSDLTHHELSAAVDGTGALVCATVALLQPKPKESSNG